MTDTTSPSILRQLADHSAWANDAVLHALRTTAGSDGHAVEQFAHVLAAQSVWLTRLRGEPQAIAVWPTLTLDECERLARANNEGYAEILADPSPTALEREVTYTNSAGKTFTNTVLDILMHVLMHGQYHRGMISILTRRSGGTPVSTDYIFYVRGVPTATRADDRFGARG